MIDLLLMQDQWIEFLNQSKLHQSLPFVFLMAMSILVLALATELGTLTILSICLNPLALVVYLLLGVFFFTTVPTLAAIVFLAFVIKYVRKLKLLRKTHD
jgi:hypothetical protein